VTNGNLLLGLLAAKMSCGDEILNALVIEGKSSARQSLLPSDPHYPTPNLRLDHPKPFRIVEIVFDQW
jgi:hypothetical protein